MDSFDSEQCSSKSNIIPSSEEQPSTSSTEGSSQYCIPAKRSKQNRKIHIAVAGCSHGEIEKIYASLAEIERRQKYKFDLLICCGDYQAVRNYGDLKHMHVPEKYRQLQTFYRYYLGELEAPILTIFIGGNHEASGYLQELPNGGWVAPKIFYMGHASVVQFAGLRIGGLSGIYNRNHYDMGHWERPPFKEYGSVVSVYHVRSVDMFRLKQLKSKSPMELPIDIMITHDWPAGITDYGDVKELLKLKPYFEEDIKKNAIGNPAAMTLLHELKPRYWLAAHMHCHFAALVPHHNVNDPENDFEPTRFLSLDKPVPGRHFLQVLEFDVNENADLKLSYDPTWLAVLRATDALTSAGRIKAYMPSQHTRDERWDFRPTNEEVSEVMKIFANDFTIPMNFRMTAPPHRAEHPKMSDECYYRNPQTTEFCAKLGIRDLNEMLCSLSMDGLGIPYYLRDSNSKDPSLKGKIDEENEKKLEQIISIFWMVDDGTTFVIDRNPTNEPSFLKNFKAPALKTDDFNESKSDLISHAFLNNPSDIVIATEQNTGNETEEGQVLRVGSGIFRRRRVDDIPKDD